MDLKALQHSWDQFAKHDPMWAILTDPARRRNKWKKDEFFKTGVEEIKALMTIIEARGFRLNQLAVLDFGCGIGRLTQAFAEHFDHCYGVDISSEMIELAKRYNQYGNRCQYIVNPSDTLPILNDNFFDMIYSTIVLQHIERKYTESYLKEFIRILKPGGLLVFQLPSSKSPEFDSLARRATRIFRVRDEIRHVLKRLGVGIVTLYRWRLSDIPAVMEMHCFEKSELESYLHSIGGRIVDVERYDAAGPAFISYRYFVTK